jgi:type I restriction enzyme, R subunit
MPPGPEDRARDKIDSLLTAAGWVIQDRDQLNLSVALGVAVREVELPSGPCDYLLFLDRKAVGVIEAKKAGITLSGVAEQSTKYMTQLPPHLKGWGETLLIDYESTGEETIFCDWRDPHPRSRHIFAFHRPEALLRSFQDGSTLRSRLTEMPPLDKRGLRDCQTDAITGLEASLSRADPQWQGRSVHAISSVHRIG